jgi:hypothetical protein
MAKVSTSLKQKILTVIALFSFISTPFLVIFGTAPLSFTLPCVKIPVWFSNPTQYTCEPNGFLSFAILLGTPIILGLVLIFIAVSEKRRA